MIDSVFVVRNELELRQARSLGQAQTFLCTNRPIFETCQKQGLSAIWLNEVDFHPRFAMINTWSFEQAFRFLDKYPKESKSRVFFEANFMDLMALFTQPLKYLSALRQIDPNGALRSLVIFDDGASLLAATFREYARTFQPSLRVQCIQQKKTTKSVRLSERLRRALFGISDLWGRYVLSIALKKKKKIIFASGGLNHLSFVVDELITRGSHQILYGENTFNLRKFIYCIRRGIAFICLSTESEPFHPRPSTGESFFNERELVFEGADYSALFDAIFRHAISSRLIKFLMDTEDLGRLFEKYCPDFVLLDEDLALRRVIAVLAERRRINCSVISHGVPGIILNAARLPDLQGRYWSGNTFVNSEFEKHMYESIYHLPSTIRVSGTPRYDRLLREGKAGGQVAAARTKVVLFCGAFMQDFDFEDWMPWVGLAGVFGEYTRSYAHDLVDLLAEEPNVLLRIKPHFREGGLWEKTAKQLRVVNKHFELLSYREDIFRLLARASVVVTSESSVVCEAIALNKPVVLLNYTPYDPVVPYEKSGLVEYVRDKRQLSQALKRCLHDNDYLVRLAAKRARSFHYYAGPFDEQHTKRVVKSLCGDENV